MEIFNLLIEFGSKYLNIITLENVALSNACATPTREAINISILN